MESHAVRVYHPVGTRRRLVSAYENGEDWVELANVLGVNIRTAKSWIRRNNAGPSQFSHGGKRISKLTELEVDEMVNWIGEDPTITLKMLQQRLYHHFSKDVSVSTVGNYLNAKLANIKKSRPISETMNAGQSKVNRKKRFGATTSSQWCSAIRSASSLSADRQPSLTLKADPPSSPSNPLAHVESCDNASCSSAPPYEATRSSTILLAPSVCDDPKGATPVDFPQPKEAELHDGSTTTWVDGTPNVTSGSLHPIAELAPVESAVPDKVRSLFDSLRSHFNNALDTFADQWQTSQSFIVSSSHLSSKHLIPTPGRLTLDKAIQSDLPESDSVPIPKADAADLRPIAASQSKNDETVTSSALIPLQVSMMEAEIDRLDRENRRLNLLLAFTRTEMAMDARHRIMELRRVWDSEVSVVLEAASKMWEQDVIKVVDAVKRKQWCAYCGRLAYYYCCWNTCYCNGICQSKHWATHINSCVQARSHTGANTGESDSLPRHQKHTPSTQVPNPTARSVLTPHSSSNPHWLNLNGS